MGITFQHTYEMKNHSRAMHARIQSIRQVEIAIMRW